MATMLEKQLNKATNDAEKLKKSLDRHYSLLIKKMAKCEKLACNWTKAEYHTHNDAKEVTAEQDNAWFEKYCEEEEIADITRRLANAEKYRTKLIAKAEGKAEADAEIERIASIESGWHKMTAEEKTKMQEEYEAWLKQFIVECARDGITISEVNSNAIRGYTAKGERFWLEGNNGFTERSWHCYTLTIANKGMIFSSGEFAAAYKYLKQK